MGLHPLRIERLLAEARSRLPRLSVVLGRLDELPRETRVILSCRHGYSSSLAAVQLRELGFADATDVIDGVEGWVAAGLPVEPASS